LYLVTQPAFQECGQRLEHSSALEQVEVVEIQRKEIEELKNEIEQLKSSKSLDETDHETTTVSSLLSFDWSSAEHIEGGHRLSEGEFNLPGLEDSRSIGVTFELEETDGISSPLNVKNFESFALKMESKSLQTQNKDLKEHIELQRRELASLTSLIEKQRTLLVEKTSGEAGVDELSHKSNPVKVSSMKHKPALMAKESPTKYHKTISSLLGLRQSKPAEEDSVEMKDFTSSSVISERKYRVLQVQSELQTEEIARLKAEMESGMFVRRQLEAEVTTLKAEIVELEKQLEDSSSQRLHMETRLREEQKLRLECESKLETSSEHFAIVVHERDALLEKHASMEDTIRHLQDALADKKDGTPRRWVEFMTHNGQYLEEKENRASTNTPTSAATSTRGALSSKSENNSRDLRNAFNDNSSSKLTLTYVNADQPSTANAIVPYDPDGTATTDDGSSSLETDARQIRLHAAKMLLWAERAIVKSRTMNASICSSFGSSQGTELRPNLTDLKPIPIPRTVTALTGAGKPPMLPQRSLVGQEEGRQLVISNLDQVNKCQCQRSLFSGNAEHADFYLPKLGMACNCGKEKEEDEDVKPENDDPCALENILRPWQVKFLTSMNIRDALGYVHAYNQRSAILAKEMRKWRRGQKLTSVKTKSCAVALHIWCRTCKAVVRSVRAQTLKGLKPSRPAFLDVSSIGEDSRTVSTLGCGSVYQLADIDVNSQMEM
jgi:hypothetical protein